MKSVNGILNGAASLSVAAIIVKIVGVIYKIPLSYIIGDEGMGYFNSAYSVYGFFYVITSTGIPKAVAMIVAEQISAGKDAVVRVLYKKSLRLFAILGLVLSVGFILLAKPLAILIGNNSAYVTMLAIAPSILFVTIAGVSRGYLNGRMRFFPIAVSQVLEAISKLLLGLLFAVIGMHLSFDLPLVAAFTVMGITIGSIVSSLYLYIATFSEKQEEKQEQKFDIAERELVGRVLRVAIPISASAAFLALSNIFDLGIIMRGLAGLGYTETESNALYGNYTTLAVPMVNLVTSILTPLSLGLLPVLVEKRIKNNYYEFSSSLNKSINLSVFFAAPFALAFHFYSFDILDILFTSNAAATGSEFLQALSPAAILLPCLTVLNTALEAKGKIGFSLLSLAMGAVVKVVFSVFLVSNPNFAMLGAPIGTVVSYIFSLILSGMLLSIGKDAVHIKILPVFLMLLSAFIAFLVPYLVVYKCGACGGGMLSILISGVISVILYVSFVHIGGFGDRSREKTGKNIQKMEENVI